MAQTIKLKRSSVASAVPSLSSLELGEVAINTNDGAIYIKRDDGSSPLDILAVHHEPTMHIDYTNNRIGIGTTSPSAIIDARDTTGSLTATQDKTAEFGRYDGTSNPRLEIRHSTAGTDLNHSYSTGANSLTFSIVGSEKMRLDSSGNLLVGKNSNSFNTDGIQANSDGQLWATSTTTPASFNRRSTDGSIAIFYKDAGVVGKIGSNSGSLYIADDDTGLFFNRASDNILPYRNDSGNEGPYDAALDLGRATARFKDFYLSGSIQGPSTFYIDPSPDDTGSPGGGVTDTGTVVILGDLQVTGTTTTVNSTEVNIGDKLITLGADATADSQNDGAGIRVLLPDASPDAYASITWNETNQRWDINQIPQLVGNSIQATGRVSFLNNSAAQGIAVESVYAGTSYSNTAPSGMVGSLNGFQVGGTTFIDSSRNMFNLGTVKAPTFINETSVIGTAAASYNLDATDFSSIYVTADATANVTINVRGDASTTLDSTLAVGDTISVEVLLTNGATAYYNSAFQIDGVAQTVDWVDGIEATTGTANEIDAYQYQILKTAANTYTVIGSFYIVGGTAPKTFIVSSGTSGDATLIIEADTDNNDENDNPRLWFKQDGGIIESAVQMTNNTLDIINNVTNSGGIRFLTGTTDNTGTTDPATGATEAMRVTSAGNVGIGTDSPAHPLQVRRAGGAGSLGISIDNVGSTDRTVQYFSIQDSATGAGAGHAFYYRPQGSTTDTFGFMLDESGNVGIGETNPQRKLTVRTDTSSTITQAAFYNADTTDGNGSVFSFRGDTSGTGAATFQEFAAISGTFDTHDHATRTGSLNFFTADFNGGGDRMTILGNGRVGVGTTSPARPFHVVAADDPSRIERTTTATGSLQGVFEVKSTTSGDMGNGFGSYISYVIEDSAGANNLIGYHGYKRANNLDNSAEFFLYTYDAGVAQESFKISPEGNTTILGNLTLGNNSGSESPTQPGDLRIYDTGNNALQILGNGANSFLFDMIGTTAQGSITFNDFDITLDGETTIQDDDGLNIYSATNGAGAHITFSDDVSGSFAQNGTLSYLHSDGAVTTTGGNSNDGWIFAGTETRTVVKVVGDIEATADAYIGGTLYTKGAGSLTPDATQPGAIVLANGGSQASPSTAGRGIEFLTADANNGYGHRLVSFDNTSGDTPLLLQRRNNAAAWTTQVTFQGNSNAVNINGDLGVQGTLTATSKSFDIEHPTKPNHRLRYGSLEGPENGVYVRGRLSGTEIELPEYWTALVDPDSITVSLTPIGPGSAWVEKIENNKITTGGSENCFYHVFAERVDIDKLVVEYEK